jgi:predicted GH43/DUF377 family glycosyl hydrolase
MVLPTFKNTRRAWLLKGEKNMKDLAQRFPQNPLLLPKDLQSSNEGLQIISLLNPGVFRYQDKTWLLVRVAEGAAQKEGVIFSRH